MGKSVSSSELRWAAAGPLGFAERATQLDAASGPWSTPPSHDPEDASSSGASRISAS